MKAVFQERLTGDELRRREHMCPAPEPARCRMSRGPVEKLRPWLERLEWPSAAWHAVKRYGKLRDAKALEERVDFS